MSDDPAVEAVANTLEMRAMLSDTRLRRKVARAAVEAARPIIEDEVGKTEARIRELEWALACIRGALNASDPDWSARAAVRTEPETDGAELRKEAVEFHLRHGYDGDPDRPAAKGGWQIRLCDAVLFTKADDPLVCCLCDGHPGDHADPSQQRLWRG